MTDAVCCVICCMTLPEGNCAQQTDSVARTAEPTAERTSSQKGLRSPVAMVMPAASHLAFSFACNTSNHAGGMCVVDTTWHSAHLGRQHSGSRGMSRSETTVS